MNEFVKGKLAKFRLQDDFEAVHLNSGPKLVQNLDYP